MKDKIEVVMNWSSGKDAALAFHVLTQQGYNVKQLLTTVSAERERVFMHGIREELLDAQADRMGLPLLKVKFPAAPDDTLYKQAMREHLTGLKQQGISTAAFGDIFLEDLRVYREEQLAQIDTAALFPLWKKDTKELVRQVEQEGIEAIIVCVDERYLGKEFLGRKINAALLEDLPDNVDPCGENGEYHTFVYNAPFFSAPISIQTGEVVHRTYQSGSLDMGFYFMDVVLQ